MAVLGERFGGTFRDDHPRRQGAKIELGAAVDLVDQIDAHLGDVDEGRAKDRLLSVSTEHEIRQLLREYVKAVKAIHRRDRLNAAAPIAAFVVCGLAAAFAGDTEDLRSTDLFGSLAQVLPVLLLALAVEVRFLAAGGLPQVLTVVTVLLVSLGFGFCVYVVVTDNPVPAAGGFAVGAAAAGLTGLVAAVLWRTADPRELFRATS